MEMPPSTPITFIGVAHAGGEVTLTIPETNLVYAMGSDLIDGKRNWPLPLPQSRQAITVDLSTFKPTKRVLEALISLAYDNPEVFDPEKVLVPKGCHIASFLSLASYLGIQTSPEKLFPAQDCTLADKQAFVNAKSAVLNVVVAKEWFFQLVTVSQSHSAKSQSRL